MTGDPDEVEGRREELTVKLVGLLEEYRDALAPGVPMPCLTDWVLVAAIDSVADPRAGRLASVHPPCQWVYRTVGLLSAASGMVATPGTED